MAALKALEEAVAFLPRVASCRVSNCCRATYEVVARLRFRRVRAQERREQRRDCDVLRRLLLLVIMEPTNYLVAALPFLRPNDRRRLSCSCPGALGDVRRYSSSPESEREQGCRQQLSTIVFFVKVIGAQ